MKVVNCSFLDIMSLAGPLVEKKDLLVRDMYIWLSICCVIACRLQTINMIKMCQTSIFAVAHSLLIERVCYIHLSVCLCVCVGVCTCVCECVCVCV